MRGCLRRVLMLAVLLVALAAAWVFREPIRRAWTDLRGGPALVEQPSEALAVRAEDKLDGLRSGSARSASLSGREIESLLLFRYPGVLPAFLDSPRVELANDQLRLRARIPIDKLPRIQDLELAAFMPDTTELTIAGKLLPLDSGRVAFGVDQVSAARVPLPSRLVPAALERLGRRDEPGLPRDAIALPLPPGAAAAYVRRDSLVLLARQTQLDNN